VRYEVPDEERTRDGVAKPRVYLVGGCGAQPRESAVVRLALTQRRLTNRPTRRRPVNQSVAMTHAGTAHSQPIAIDVGARIPNSRTSNAAAQARG
jgi:hypothetical protein